MEKKFQNSFYTLWGCPFLQKFWRNCHSGEVNRKMLFYLPLKMSGNSNRKFCQMGRGLCFMLQNCIFCLELGWCKITFSTWCYFLRGYEYIIIVNATCDTHRYCDCFANGEFCSNCNCVNCSNNMEHEKERSKAIKVCTVQWTAK